MNEKWSDFEKFVFKELSTISTRLSRLEGRAATWGALAGVVGAAVIEAAVKIFQHS